MITVLSCHVQNSLAVEGLDLEVGYIQSFLWFLVLYDVLIQELHH